MPSRWDNVTVAEGVMRCYVADPAKRPSPGVIVIQHAGGVDDFVRSMCDRLAGDGFVAVAPDLYHREEPGSSDDPMTRMGRLRDATIVRDVNASVEHARTLQEIDSDRLGVTGFCMGGRVAYLMAAHQPAFKAAVVFYGGNIMVPWGDGPAPFELTDQIACPVLGLFGNDDPNPSPADVAKIDAEMTRLGKEHEFHGHEGVGHGFMHASRQGYREDVANSAWDRCIDWFTRYLRR
jgi:carboxymethylenebutenolidase